MKRKIYLDYAKVFACFAVMVQHYCNLAVENRGEYTLNYFFYYICRFAVPIFVMSTGSLMLEDKKEITFKAVITKYIPRILIPFIAVIYLINITATWIAGTLGWKILLSPLIGIFRGQTSVPYWYCYMIIGIYLVLPFIKKMVNHCTKNELTIYLILFFAVRGLQPYMQFIPLLREFEGFFNAAPTIIFGGYLGYLVLGYYIDKYLCEISKKQLIVSAAVFVVSLVLPLVVFLSSGDRYREVGAWCGDVFAPTMILNSAALMILLKGCLQNTKNTHRTISKISQATYGMYLLHVYVIHWFGYLAIPVLGNTYTNIIFRALITFGICFLATYLLKQLSGMIKKQIRSNMKE